MKVVQMTIDEVLLNQMDEIVKALDTTRSAFIRSAVQHELQRYETAKLEQQHAEGYSRHPVQPGEFDGWESEQVWGES